MKAHNTLLLNLLAGTIILSATYCSCDPNTEQPTPNDPDPTPVVLPPTDTVKGVYKGTLLEGSWSGSESASTTETRIFELVKTADNKLKITGFGGQGESKYTLFSKTDSVWTFPGDNSNINYSFGLQYFPKLDSVSIHANRHIGAGTGQSWNFYGRKL